jgi:Xaa-Pro aminopeptidase
VKSASAGDYRRRRLAAVRREMTRRGVDAFLLTDLRNIRYLTGFTGSSGMALLTTRRAILVTDFRYRTQVGAEVGGFEFIELKGATEPFLTSLLAETTFSILGFESSAPFTFYRRIRRAARPRRIKAVEGVVEGIRAVKDAGEVAVLERLVAVAVQGFSEFVGRTLAPGMSEREAAWELESSLRRAGSGPPPFPIIVASGENGAMPHATPGDRVIRVGDPIVFDFGTEGEGYATDMTRTLCLGEPSPEVAAMYSVVYDAQVSALAAVGPRVRASRVDRAARSVIGERGMSALFGHSTGHGLGLEIHEGPALSPDGKETLRPGMVVTVEPGVYLPGVGGVRIEDMVLVTPDGSRVLTATLPKAARLGR